MGISQYHLSKYVDLTLNTIVKSKTRESPQSYRGNGGENPQSAWRSCWRFI